MKKIITGGAIDFKENGEIEVNIDRKWNLVKSGSIIDMYEGATTTPKIILDDTRDEIYCDWYIKGYECDDKNSYLESNSSYNKKVSFSMLNLRYYLSSVVMIVEQGGEDDTLQSLLSYEYEDISIKLDEYEQRRGPRMKPNQLRTVNKVPQTSRSQDFTSIVKSTSSVKKQQEISLAQKFHQATKHAQHKSVLGQIRPLGTSIFGPNPFFQYDTRKLTFKNMDIQWRKLGAKYLKKIVVRSELTTL